MSRPFLSIVVASYNQGAYLERMIQSVLNQNCRDWELIVIDGGSSDGSVEILRRYEKHFRFWQSKPDDGQSDAFNQGFAHASGAFFTWLNTDDLLLPSAVETLVRANRKSPHCEWWVGSTAFIDSADQILYCGVPNSHCRFLVDRGIINVGGPSSFFSRSIWEELQPMRTDLHYAMDTEFWLRMAAKGHQYRCLNQYVWAMRLHANAKTSSHLFAETEISNSFQEHPSIAKRREEKEQIERLHVKKTKFGLSKSTVAIFRLVTGAGLRARLDTKRLVGKSVEQVFPVFEEYRTACR